MAGREKVIKDLHDARRYLEDKEWSDRGASPHIDAINDALALLKEQEKIKEHFIEAFNTIRDAYNASANREKILLNYLARNACCCEQKLLIDGGQFADMPTMQSAT